MKNKLTDLALIVVILVLFMTLYLQIQEPRLVSNKPIQKYLSENVDKNGILVESSIAVTTTSQTQKKSSSVPAASLLHPEVGQAQTSKPNESIGNASEFQQLQDAIEWYKKRGIELVGVKKNAHDLYYKGLTEEDILPVVDIPNVSEVIKGLNEIPQTLLKVMKGKTFYLSQLPGRGNAVTASWPKLNILVNMNRGCVIEQPLTRRQTIHEFAHILDFHGIQGIYEDPHNHWSDLKELRDEIFDVPFAYNRKLPEPPAGYMDIYSTANPAENFAQHFMHYILYGDEFRKKALGNKLLKKKYDFFKKYLFNNLEYLLQS